ncbi:MAG: hypothetical protein AAF348_14935 [Bacteroidota bacterium]
MKAPLLTATFFLLITSLSFAQYPTRTSRGDVVETYKKSNNIIELGNESSTNARKAWLLARHSTLSTNLGRFYSSFHLQPDVGNKTQYRGVGIGYSASTNIPKGVHLAIDGRTGIGTKNPSALLSVATAVGSSSFPTASSMGNVLQTLDAGNNTIEFGNAIGNNERKAWILARHSDTERFGEFYSTLHLQPDVGDKSQYIGVAVGFPTDSSLPIGTHLAVNGNISAKEVICKIDGLPDYVFEKNYDLPSLAQVEKYIKTNGHLEHIPTAKTAAEDGVGVADMTSKLLRKIEELTLYTIQQQKEIEALRTLVTRSKDSEKFRTHE